MKNLIVFFCVGLIVFSAAASLAAPDQYPGDTSIYGNQTVLPPNVLLILDNSGSMSDSGQMVSGGSYSKTTTYTPLVECGTSWIDTCGTNSVYAYIPASGDTPPMYTLLNSDINNIAATCSYTYNSASTKSGDTCVNTGKSGSLKYSCTHTDSVRSVLQGSSGTYTGWQLNPDGSCGANHSNYTYYLGNYVNYLYTPGSAMLKIDVVKNVVGNLLKSTTGVNFGLMIYNYDENNNGWGGTLIQQPPAGSSLSYLTSVQNMDAVFDPSTTPPMTNRTALRRVVSTLWGYGDTPLGSTLMEAGQYFKGGPPLFNSTVGITSGTYTTPVTASCQKNYVVFLTDGMSTNDYYYSAYNSDKSKLDPGPVGRACENTTDETKSGDCDGDGKEPVLTYYTGSVQKDAEGIPNGCSGSSTTNNSQKKCVQWDFSDSLDDVARALNLGPQNITLYTIGFGQVNSDATAVSLLTRAADSTHGKGAFYTASSQTDLSKAFTSIISNILAVNSSYVAPVVPVSPENRTFGANRVYMGFFKPQGQAAWFGNVKKYGLDTNTNVIDVNGTIANWVDVNGDGKDDNSGANLPSGAINGTFKSSAQSYWSPTPDAGDVTTGGAGSKLQTQANITTTRTIYTLTPTNANTPGSSLIALNNTNITTTILNVPDSTSRTNLINYVYGLDVYGTNTTANRGWVMGDVLHSKPLIINYATYTVNSSNESNCSVNKSLIFVGANDGMLHAIKDCDGTEAWAFVPPDELANLQLLAGPSASSNHLYFADSSPAAYVYDANNNGTIETGDKVILVFGERRGGGTNTSPTSGAYYVLDVTNPLSPTFLWKVDSSTSGFSELGESWSEPKLLKMKIGTADKIVVFFGAGYDNPNEDGRYGATQYFPATNPPDISAIGKNNVTSATGTGTSPYYLNPKGRGVYAVELATLSATGVPTITTTPTKTWGFTYGASTTATTSPSMLYSFPSELAAIDADNNGYADTIYAGDTGGNVWRFDVGNTSTTNWTATKIFDSNGGMGSDIGRKIFFKPSIVLESTYRRIYFATGDREHPLNTSVTDRVYMLKDPNPPSAISTALHESDLVDVTTDQLQTTTTPNGQAGSISDILNQLTTQSGWFLQLNQNSGEKVLAVPMVFNKALYFTTYAPGVTNTDPCLAGNLGTSRLYAVDYSTGEAVLDYDTTNDGITPPNSRSLSSSGKVLGRSDRVKTTGTGIPSGLVIVITPGGNLKALTGVGGAIPPDNPKPGGAAMPLYWRQK